MNDDEQERETREREEREREEREREEREREEREREECEEHRRKWVQYERIIQRREELIGRGGSPKRGSKPLEQLKSEQEGIRDDIWDNEVQRRVPIGDQLNVSKEKDEVSRQLREEHEFERVDGLGRDRVHGGRVSAPSAGEWEPLLGDFRSEEEKRRILKGLWVTSERVIQRREEELIKKGGSPEREARRLEELKRDRAAIGIDLSANEHRNNVPLHDRFDEGKEKSKVRKELRADRELEHAGKRKSMMDNIQPSPGNAAPPRRIR